MKEEVAGERTLNLLLEKIPEAHRGISFERILQGFNPSEKTRLVEEAFARAWADRNDSEKSPLLFYLLVSEEDTKRKDALPKTPREWDVAFLVAATIMQWLPTSAGCAFLDEAFKKGGGSINYTLPKTEESIIKRG